MKAIVMTLNMFLVMLSLAACNPRLKFANTDPNYKPTAKNLIADNYDSTPLADELPEEDYSDLDDTIAAFEKNPPAVTAEPTPVTTKEVQDKVASPQLTELEKELATAPEAPEEVKTIDIEEINALSRPNKPAPLPKPKLKNSPKPQANDEKEIAPTAVSMINKEIESAAPVKAPTINNNPIVITQSDINEVHSETELFQQTESKVDILFVVDNSPSMMREQEKLGERLQSFLKGIRHMDWQIAFTTSDVSNGKYGIKGSLLDLYNHPGQRVLKSSFPDAEEIFYNTVQRSEGKNCIFGCPSSKEQPLKASILAMQKRSAENAVFFRDDADLSIVILSDEDEMSKGSSKATKPQAVIDSFHSVFGDEKKLSVYGIIIQPNDVACFEDQKSEGISNAFPGKTISELSRRTDGYTGSICEQDYAVSLEKISEQTRYLAESFRLKRTPIANSVRVKLIPEQDVEWKIERNNLMFISPPKEGTQVQITYNYL